MKKYEVYLITNKINNKKYVGQTMSSKGYLKRFDEHIKESKCNPTTYLHKAIKKYGVENFSVQLIENDIDEALIDDREIYWIEYFDSFITNSGYNMTFGGQGMHGYIFSKEDLQNISKGVKNYWKNLKSENPSKYQDWCNHLSIINKGKNVSQETRIKLSEYAKQRCGELNPFYGKHHSEVTKQTIRESNSKKIGMFTLDNIFIREFNSIYDASKYLLENNITKNKNASSRISKICRGIDKSAYGYIWKFL